MVDKDHERLTIFIVQMHLVRGSEEIGLQTHEIWYIHRGILKINGFA